VDAQGRGAWSIRRARWSRGGPLRGAVRSFNEETGAAPRGRASRSEIRQRSGKHVVAWGIEGTFNPATLVPGHFELEWPPKSGRLASFPEIDRVEWFDLDTAHGASCSAHSGRSSRPSSRSSVRRHQYEVPSAPLKGPTILEVIQPP